MDKKKARARQLKKLIRENQNQSFGGDDEIMAEEIMEVSRDVQEEPIYYPPVR